MKKVAGWVMVVVGGIAALAGALLLMQEESEGGGVILGIGIVLAAIGWSMRVARSATSSCSDDGFFNVIDYGGGGDSGGDSGDSGGDSGGE